MMIVRRVLARDELSRVDADKTEEDRALFEVDTCSGCCCSCGGSERGDAKVKEVEIEAKVEEDWGAALLHGESSYHWLKSQESPPSWNWNSLQLFHFLLLLLLNSERITSPPPLPPPPTSLSLLCRTKPNRNRKRARVWCKQKRRRRRRGYIVGGALVWYGADCRLLLLLLLFCSVLLCLQSLRSLQSLRYDAWLLRREEGERKEQLVRVRQERERSARALWERKKTETETFLAALFPSTEAVTLSIYLARFEHCSVCMICGKERAMFVCLLVTEKTTVRDWKEGK